MDNENKNVKDVSVFISKDFKISDSDSLIPADDYKTLEEFKTYLTSKLSYLLTNKYDTLINILYRIDVSEEKLHNLFNNKKRDDTPAALAELIIERSLQKIRFRQKYKAGEI